MYFSNLPILVYPMSYDGKTLLPVAITDIMSRVLFDMPESDLISITAEYQILDGESIETVSNKVYGTPYYHWVIMYTNNIFDYIGDWYMSFSQLNDYCLEKYGESIGDIAYYTDSYGNIIKPAGEIFDDMCLNDFGNIKYTGELVEVTNFMHESLQNDKKQLIRLIKPEYVNQFVDKFVAQVKKAI